MSDKLPNNSAIESLSEPISALHMDKSPAGHRETASEGPYKRLSWAEHGKVSCVPRANNGEYWRFLKYFSVLKHEITQAAEGFTSWGHNVSCV